MQYFKHKHTSFLHVGSHISEKKMCVIGKSLSNQVYDNSVPFPTIIKVQFLLAFYLFNLYTEYNFCAIAIISILANTFISLEARIFFANPLCMVYNLEPIRRSCEERGIENKMIVKYCIKCKVSLYLCVCVCVCERKCVRERETHTETEWVLLFCWVTVYMLYALSNF
jgi:hypothetical protein